MGIQKLHGKLKIALIDEITLTCAFRCLYGSLGWMISSIGALKAHQALIVSRLPGNALDDSLEGHVDPIA